MDTYEDVSTQSDNYHDQQLVTDEHVPCRIAPSEVRRCDCSRHGNCHFGLIHPRTSPHTRTQDTGVNHHQPSRLTNILGNLLSIEFSDTLDIFTELAYECSWCKRNLWIVCRNLKNITIFYVSTSLELVLLPNRFSNTSKCIRLCGSSSNAQTHGISATVRSRKHNCSIFFPLLDS